MADNTPHVDLGIVVRDIDVCLPFYRDVIGLPMVRDFDLPGGSHMWQLACGECRVKLITHKSAPEAANPPGGMRGGTGLRYWTMTVEDIEQTVARCESAGAPIALKILEMAPGIKLAMVEDPEGNVVEFVEDNTSTN